MVRPSAQPQRPSNCIMTSLQVCRCFISSWLFIDQPIDRLTGWLADSLTHQEPLSWSLTHLRNDDWLTEHLFDCRADWLNYWTSGLTEWMIGLLNKDLPTDLTSPFHFILQPVTWVLQFLLTSLNLSTWKKRNTLLKMDKGRYDRCEVLTNLPLCIREDNETIEIIFHLSICLLFYINLWGQI